MGVSPSNRSALAYRQALQHPVFIQTVGLPDRNTSRDDASSRSVNEGRGASADFCNAERRLAVQRMLRFLDLAQQWWSELAPTHAPELAIMADLYINEYLGRSVSVGDACIAARVPFTSALRSIDRLIASGMLVRYGDPRDSRRKLLALTEDARPLMARFTDHFIRDMRAGLA